MAGIIVKEVTNQDEWEDFLALHPEANFLHSYLWGIFNQRIGKQVHYSGFYEDEKLAGVMLSIIEPARRGRYLTVPGGPIIDWSRSEMVQAIRQEMIRLGKIEKCVFVRVRPQLLNTEHNRQLFHTLGFQPAQMHLHAELTSQLDITADEPTLLQHFRKNTRYELKQAKKRGIKVTSTTDPSAIEEFYQLQLETAKRHKFVPYGKKFLREQFAVFAEAGKAILYSAHTTGNKLIAQAFIIFYLQEAAYHYGASTELGRSEPGAYAIQWEAIREAKRRGISRYNFWGVVDPSQTNHRFWGVSVFKRGFRGEDVEYLHAHDLVLKQISYLPNLTIEYVRKRRRHL